jgi:hypothetical protein
MQRSTSVSVMTALKAVLHIICDLTQNLYFLDNTFNAVPIYILSRVGDIGHPGNKPFVLQCSSDKFDFTFILNSLLL